MATIVIAETIATVGVDALKAAGHTIHELSGQPRESLVAALREADALIVRVFAPRVKHLFGEQLFA